MFLLYPVFLCKGEKDVENILLPSAAALMYFLRSQNALCPVAPPHLSITQDHKALYVALAPTFSQKTSQIQDQHTLCQHFINGNGLIEECHQSYPDFTLIGNKTYAKRMQNAICVQPRS